MKKRLGAGILFVLLLISASLLGFAQTRNRAATTSDIKIKYRSTVAGQTSESTSMIKGTRERSETQNAYTGNMINITQCDLKRTIQISDKNRKYVISQMEIDDASGTSQPAPATNTSGSTRRGGIVTYTSTATDTGERKEMFGFTARHIKTSLNIESSPDACSPTKQRMETDGWYIDLSVGLDCYSGRPQMMANRGMRPDCQDQTRFRRLGTAKTGYPLNETVTMYGPDGTEMFTMTKEVVDLSREPLDSALFDLPAGYTEAQSAQELYAQPSMAVPSMPMAQPNESSSESTSGSSDRKAPGTLRIGIVPLNNKTDHPVSTESLRARLIGEIQGAGIEAVPLNAESQAAADAEAKEKQCDFVLYTDISALKSSKAGGMFGRVTGVGGLAKTDSRIDFRLFAVGSGSPLLQSSATGKEDGDEQSAGIALDSEARTVIGAVRRR